MDLYTIQEQKLGKFILLPVVKAKICSGVVRPTLSQTAVSAHYMFSASVVLHAQIDYNPRHI